MKALQIVEDIKQDITKRHSLTEQRREIERSVAKGRDFFMKEANNTASSKRLVQGAELMADYIKRLNQIDQEIFTIDSFMVAKLETFFSDFVAKLSVSEKVNDAGDLVSKQQAYFVPFKSDDVDVIEVTVSDLWYLKMLKSAIGVNNVELIPKSKYYSDAKE